MKYKIIAQDRLVELLKKERLLHNIIPLLEECSVDKIIDIYKDSLSKSEYNVLKNTSNEDWVNIFVDYNI